MSLRTLRLCSAQNARVLAMMVAVTPLPTAKAAEAAPAASWQLAQDGTERACPLMLRFDAAGRAGALAMPAGCRRSLPFLASARTWSIDDSGSIQFRDGAGQSLLALVRHAGAWQGDDEAGHSFTLTPPSAAAIAAAQPDAGAVANPGPVALASPQSMSDESQMPAGTGRTRIAAAAKADSGATVPAAAGRYAVMRGDRDTGCMVTLETGGKGAARARLAPACRDQGITIFDPISWQMKGGELVLTARRGHSIGLARDETGTWIKLPKDVKALGLKPL